MSASNILAVAVKVCAHAGVQHATAIASMLVRMASPVFLAVSGYRPAVLTDNGSCRCTNCAALPGGPLRFLVALPFVLDLLLCARHLFVEAMVAMASAGRVDDEQCDLFSRLNSDQDLASIPTAQGGLSRLAIARLKQRRRAGCASS